MKKTVADPSYRAAATTAIAAWTAFRAKGTNKDGKNDATSAPFSDYGAEAQFALVDDQIHKEYDVETGVNHKYAGSVPGDVIGEADKAGKRGSQAQGSTQKRTAKLAQKYDDDLEQIVKTYPSQEWVPAAIARQGSVYDALRTGLYNASLRRFTTSRRRRRRSSSDSRGAVSRSCKTRQTTSAPT